MKRNRLLLYLILCFRVGLMTRGTGGCHAYLRYAPTLALARRCRSRCGGRMVGKYNIIGVEVGAPSQLIQLSDQRKSQYDYFLMVGGWF